MPDLEAPADPSSNPVNDSASAKVETDTLKTNENDKKSDDDEKKKEEDEKPPDHGGLKTIGKMYGNRYWCVWIFAWIATIIHGCILPAFGILFRELIDVIIYETNRQKAAVDTVIYFVAAGVIGLISSVAQSTLWGIYGTNIGVEMRKAYLQKLLSHEIAYHDEKNSGKLNTKLISESFAVDSAIGVKNGFVVEQLVMFCFGFVFAFLYSWQMTLVLLATFPVTVCIGAIQGLAFHNMGGQSADPFSDAGGNSFETLMNVKTIVAFPALVTGRLETYRGYLDKAGPLARKRAKVIGAGGGAMMFGLFSISYGLGLFYGMILVERGDLRISNMFGAFFSYIMGGMALGQLGSATGDIQKGQMSANWFLSVFLRKPEIKPPDGAPIQREDPKGTIKGKIEFKGVSFAYASNPDKYVLDSIDFTVNEGAQLAIVGPSGSGKSTIINLIERFYDPTIGLIEIDGVPIHNFGLTNLRDQIGVVSQLPLLFDTTIAENVRGGRKDLTMDDVVNACKRASAHEFIMKMPDKYDSMIGEMGDKLSGGQKQRISIARAIIGNPAILLLDEATSALDSKSEREVQKAIDKIAGSKSQTIVTIAHRLSTIKRADNIIVLVNGEIDEEGTHEELMGKEEGMYATLVKSQRLVDEKVHAHEVLDSDDERDDDLGGDLATAGAAATGGDDEKVEED